MHKRSWLSHGKYWEPRPVRYFVNDLMDCHHHLICFILPSPPPPKVRAPHHEFYRQNVRLGLKSAALLWLGHRFWCVVLKDSHACVMVVATGGTDMWKRKMWGNFDTVYRFLQKSVEKKVENTRAIKDSVWTFCFTFPDEWLKWRCVSWNGLSPWSVTQPVRALHSEACLWNCPSDVTLHESTSQIINLCLQTSFKGAIIYPPYPLTPRELLHSAGEHHWCLVFLSFIWSMKEQVSKDHSLKTVPDLTDSVALCWPEVGSLRKPFSFILTSHLWNAQAH